MPKFDNTTARDLRSYLQNIIIREQRSGATFAQIEMPAMPEYPSRYSLRECLNIAREKTEKTADETQKVALVEQEIETQTESNNITVCDVFDNFGKEPKKRETIQAKFVPKEITEPAEVNAVEKREIIQEELASKEITVPAPGVTSESSIQVKSEKISFFEALKAVLSERRTARLERRAMKIDYYYTCNCKEIRHDITRRIALERIAIIEEVLGYVDNNYIDENDCGYNPAGGTIAVPVPMHKE